MMEGKLCVPRPPGHAGSGGQSSDARSRHKHCTETRMDTRTCGHTAPWSRASLGLPYCPLPCSVPSTPPSPGLAESLREFSHPGVLLAAAAFWKEPEAALAFLSCCTQGPARARQPKAKPYHVCLPSLFPAPRPNPASIGYSCKRFLPGIGICIIQAELWHKPPLGTATMGQGICGSCPSQKAANMGRPRTLRSGESLPKCRNANTANLLGKEGGEKRLQLPK